MNIINFLWAAFFSLLPVSELRGAIPFAFANGMPLHFAYPFCVFCNMLVAPLVYVFLSSIHKLLYKWSKYQMLFDKIVVRARQKVQGKVERFGYWGIMLFVAIPFPITGAYTGTLGAWVLGLSAKKTCLTVAGGVIISGAIVTTIVYLSTQGFHMLDLFIKQVHTP